jgi:hypothetical protein
MYERLSSSAVLKSMSATLAAVATRAMSWALSPSCRMAPLPQSTWSCESFMPLRKVSIDLLSLASRFIFQTGGVALGRTSPHLLQRSSSRVTMRKCLQTVLQMRLTCSNSSCARRTRSRRSSISQLSSSALSFALKASSL